LRMGGSSIQEMKQTQNTSFVKIGCNNG